MSNDMEGSTNQHEEEEEEEEPISQEHEEIEEPINQRHEEKGKPINQDQQQSTNKKLRRYDSLDIESAKLKGNYHMNQDSSWMVILQLAFQSIGVVYGDIGTSPLYTISSVFSDGIQHNDDILGVLSLIFYTLTLLPLIKYVFIVLRANDNGNGGTFALYSLICRHAKVGLLPNQETEDREMSSFQLGLPNNRVKRASKLQSCLEKSTFSKFSLLFATMLGTSMVIGDGVLTPCISVLSAVGGIKEATSAMTQERIVWISVVILVLLFWVQRFGTAKVGYAFAPILCLWFFLIGGIGLYNLIKYDPSVVKCLNPKYIFDYFKRNKVGAWISLGGVILCTTGAEALFADVGHFSVRSIQVSMCTLIYPALLLAYAGQGSYLRKNNQDVSDPFFKSIPGPMYWPMFVVAVLSAVIASQSMISGTFSIIQQSLSLGCFPRVKVVHTSAKIQGQVYVPEINYFLMLACVAVTLGFKTTIQIGNAYGIAVVLVMFLTSAFLVLIMMMVWKTHILLILAYILVIGLVELAYLSSVLYKFNQGGYLPLAFAAFLMSIMYIWNYVYRKKYNFELNHKISAVEIKELSIAQENPFRLPGLAIFYSDLVHGIPPIFKHYFANVPALHSVLVFVSIKSLPISQVPVEERFLFRRVKPNELQIYRCVIRYGYKDELFEQEVIQNLLFEKLKEYIINDNLVNEQASDIDIEVLDQAWKAGVVHLVGEHDVVAKKGANIAKRILIDYAYNFLKRNLRQSNKVFDIPHEKMLKVGMVYEL